MLLLTVIQLAGRGYAARMNNKYLLFSAMLLPLGACCSTSGLFTLSGTGEEAVVSDGRTSFEQAGIEWLPDGEGGRLEFEPALYNAFATDAAFWTMDVNGKLRELEGDGEWVIPDEIWYSATEIVGDAEQVWVAGLGDEERLEIGYFDGQDWATFQWDHDGDGLSISNLALQDGQAQLLIETYYDADYRIEEQLVSCDSADCTLSSPGMTPDIKMSASDFQGGGDGALWRLTEGYAQDGDDYVGILSRQDGCELEVPPGLQALTSSSDGVTAWGWTGKGAVQWTFASDCSVDELLLEKTVGSDGSTDGRSFGDRFVVGTRRPLKRTEKANASEESCAG